ncbi:MAG: site-2 protease family protein [Crenarchaeota archaeon]|nr:site-2 protease family protein [Thermoproteota archaeon]
MKPLLRAGLSIGYINEQSIKGTRVIDIYIDRTLDEQEFQRIYHDYVAGYGYMPLQLDYGQPVIRLIKINTRKRRKLQLFLLSITSITVFLTGLALSPSIFDAIIYTACFLGALALHEFGHMLASRKYKVIIDGPFFIPAPPAQLGFIGTLGAVISMKTLPPNRRSLAIIGLAGPLLGFTAAIVIGLVGVYMSSLISVEQAARLIQAKQAAELSFIPLALQILIAIRGVPQGYTIMLHPLAFASFIVFIVTFLNLLPIGQLDGGHVIRSLTSPRTHNIISYLVIAGVLLTGSVLLGIGQESLGYYYSFLGFILIIFKLIFGRGIHPGPANQLSIKKPWWILPIYIALLLLSMPIA